MAWEWRRSPGVGRYALPEIERRFLVGDGVPNDLPPWLIEDRYIDGTSLRLRRLSAEGETVWKLAQKIRADPTDPGTVSITNIYLQREEYELFVSLPAAVLRKTRRICLHDGVRFALDTFEGHLADLRLAEVEVTKLAVPLPRPAWLGREITHDDRFSGGQLARTSADQLAMLLASIE
jgi:CYTH domain-containing protein